VLGIERGLRPKKFLQACQKFADSVLSGKVCPIRKKKEFLDILNINTVITLI
jgi:hypothetical protein